MTGPVEKDHTQLLEELLVEVRTLRVHMHTVSKYVEGLTARIESVLKDDPTSDTSSVIREEDQ